MTGMGLYRMGVNSRRVLQLGKAGPKWFSASMGFRVFRAG